MDCHESPPFVERHNPPVAESPTAYNVAGCDGALTIFATRPGCGPRRVHVWAASEAPDAASTRTVAKMRRTKPETPWR
jgi:hypothetical protein